MDHVAVSPGSKTYADNRKPYSEADRISDNAVQSLQYDRFYLFFLKKSRIPYDQNKCRFRHIRQSGNNIASQYKTCYCKHHIAFGKNTAKAGAFSILFPCPYCITLSCLRFIFLRSAAIFVSYSIFRSYSHVHKKHSCSHQKIRKVVIQYRSRTPAQTYRYNLADECRIYPEFQRHRAKYHHRSRPNDQRCIYIHT